MPGWLPVSRFQSLYDPLYRLQVCLNSPGSTAHTFIGLTNYPHLGPCPPLL